MASKANNTNKISLVEAKRNSRQKMLKGGGNDTAITTNNNNSMKDIYGNALSSLCMIRGETSVIYDESMILHKCLWDESYPENGERFTSVMNRCRELKLFERCKILKSRLATKEEVLMVHTEEQYDLLKTTSGCVDEEKLEDLSSNYDAIYINSKTFDISLLACGSTIELVDSILDNECQNGMAIIRPPGHHAMKAEYNGYCFFNNVAVAAQHALQNKGINKILIVDWVST